MEQVPVSSGRMFCIELAVPEQAADGAPTLEFVMTNGKGQWDNRPEDGGKNYQINGAGRFILEQGRLTRSSGRRMMVVSDLDGTMVGEDAATAEFRDFWEDRALARGSKLVFNSGRTLESIQQLLCEKQHCLAVPDACICAVGTRVFWREPGGSEGDVRALKWREDEAWGAVLDRAWDLAAVRDAAYAALAMVGKERMHFRPPEEQNDHKVTCGLAADVAQQVVAHMEAHLADRGVVANIVVSGIGDWRFMDVVPVAAGKLEATKHVQQQLGFMPDETIACGDSGNDILMLAGDHLAVAVGNAHPDLVSWVEQQHRSPEVKERLFRASRTTANGILEGLDRFGFDIHLA